MGTGIRWPYQTGNWGYKAPYKWSYFTLRIITDFLGPTLQVPTVICEAFELRMEEMKNISSLTKPSRKRTRKACSNYHISMFPGIRHATVTI